MTAHDPRSLEWQRRYEEKDTPWDKGAAAPPLVHYLRENAIAGRVLVPGCGRGHDVRALARQHGCSAVGLDLAPAAIDEARRLPPEFGPGSEVSFVTGDFFKLTFDLKNTFDWVVEHTCFCAIDPALRPEYAISAANALRPGGKFFGIFYLTPDVESGPPFAVSRAELSNLFEDHFILLNEWVPEECFPGREGRELVRILQKR